MDQLTPEQIATEIANEWRVAFIEADGAAWPEAVRRTRDAVLEWHWEARHYAAAHHVTAQLRVSLAGYWLIEEPVGEPPPRKLRTREWPAGTWLRWRSEQGGDRRESCVIMAEMSDHCSEDLLVGFIRPMLTAVVQKLVGAARTWVVEEPESYVWISEAPGLREEEPQEPE